MPTVRNFFIRGTAPTVSNDDNSDNYEICNSSLIKSNSKSGTNDFTTKADSSI